jgi:hypothetical protein
MLMPNIYIFDFSFVLLNGFLVRIVVFRNWKKTGLSRETFI